MKHTIGILAIFVLLIAGAMLFSGCGKKVADTGQNAQITEEQTEGQPNDSGTTAGKPWIQVVKDGVFLISSGTEKNTLKTGDEMNEGAIIETDKNGLANIYFPDGSVARLDSQTKITLSAGLYDVNTKTLTVKIKLAAGNLWSKIMKLATPESVWEVHTANAVAAVRGSAFGMSFSRGKTRVIGSEHVISVNPINPKTGEMIKGQQAAVGENNYLEISDALALDFASGERDIKRFVKPISGLMLSEDWIKASLEADQKINERVQIFEGSGLTNDQALDRYREEVTNEFEPFITDNFDDATFDVVTSSGDSIDLLDVVPDGGSEIIIEPDTGPISDTTSPNYR